MHLVKRIEIFINYVELAKILEALEHAGVAGHTVIRNVASQDKGNKLCDDLDVTMLDNVYVIAFFPPEQLSSVETNIRAILNKFGGACFVSDAMELETTKRVG
ncbi:P-II family nitrogen regulator [Fortiea contorta]|uniref:P-II family nitrogen regulator n=1 Tax=Fortiea contorta TaxID=1892405 RepID=UPI00034A191F|nr:hypothetical protein [Fortiea contorta]